MSIRFCGDTCAYAEEVGLMGTDAAFFPDCGSAPLEDKSTEPTVAEFFAGIGLVRLGLERAGFRVVWANDIEPAKAKMYRGHFKDETDHYMVEDIAQVSCKDLPKGLSLAWASFPCIDVSLAGWRRGLNGQHTGTFWHFIRILSELHSNSEFTLPPVVALENVTGLATSHKGQDLTDTIKALNELGYSVDVLVLDARRFVAQSRPRLFLVGALNPPTDSKDDVDELRPPVLRRFFEDGDLLTHRAALPQPPPLKNSGLSEAIEALPDDDPQWWPADRTKAFLDSLSQIQKARLDVLQDSLEPVYRTAYRRTRNGVPTWEIRADEIAGCLRTARGGSSKQALVKASKQGVRVRWMTGREYANLMGANDYALDGLGRNQALYGFGDAVSVDAVAWLGEHYLMPLLRGELLQPAGDANPDLPLAI